MSLGTFELSWKTDARLLAVEETHAAAEQALDDCLDFLLGEANKTVPHEEGTLEKSGDKSRDGLTGCVFYDTPYARRQHEELGYHHNEGRRAKWLELTFQEQSGTVKERLAAAIGGKLS